MSKNLKIFLLANLCILALSVLFTPFSFAADYYVSEGGSDSDDGSLGNPWETIQHAADTVVGGDTVIVQTGTYDGFVISTAGTATDRITFRAANSSVVLNTNVAYEARSAVIHVTGNYVTIDGFRMIGESGSNDRGIRISKDSGDDILGIEIKNCRVSNMGSVGISTSFAVDILIENNEVWGSGNTHGVYVANSGDNPIVRGNASYNNDRGGIQINADPLEAGDGIITNALVENNIVYNNGTSGLNFASIRNSLIRNNLVYDNQQHGIASWDDEAGDSYGSKDNKYLNNTVVAPSGGAHAFSLRNGSTGNVVKNNILIHEGGQDSIAVDTESMAGLDSDYNIVTNIEDPTGSLVSLTSWQNNYNQDNNSIVATASSVFENPGSDNYKLKAGSPAIDQGANLSGDVNFDLLGVVRPQAFVYDIGTYENTLSGAYYISPIGSDSSGDGSYNNPWRTFTQASSQMSGGDTLIYKDGIYDYPGSNIVDPVSGSAVAYTTIKAEHDGQAKINGIGSRIPIDITGEGSYIPRYIRIEGFYCYNSSDEVIDVSGVDDNHRAEYIEIRRVGAKNAGGATDAICSIGNYAQYCLIEDCWFWGVCRTGVLLYGKYPAGPHTNNIIVRRVVVRFDAVQDGSQGENGFSFYGADDSILENCIAIDFANGANAGAGFRHRDGSSDNKYYGCIAINTGNFRPFNLDSDMTYGLLDCVGVGTTKSVFVNCRINPEFNIDRCTFIGSSGDVLDTTSSSGVNVTNCLFKNCGSGDEADSYCHYDNSGSDYGTNASSGDSGLLYSIKIEDGSACDGTGQGGVDRGANVLNRYVNGTLTQTSLWPWPNENRIKLEMRESITPPAGSTPPTVDAQRGFCADTQTLTSYVWGYLSNPPPPVYPPSELTARSVSLSEIRLDWKDNAQGEDGFEIERKKGVGGTYVRIATVGQNVIAYDDRSLAGNTTYYYQVRAVYDSTEKTAYSNEAYATTGYTLATPSNLTAQLINDNCIALAWEDNSVGIDGFKIERSVEFIAGNTEIDITDPDTNIYIDTGRSLGTKYNYRIRSYNDHACSGYSNPASAITPESSDGGGDGEGDVAAAGGGGSSSDDGGLCFIATAAFGTSLADEVVTLCRFRDKYLLSNTCGKLFVGVYYKCSPDVAEYIKEKEEIKAVVRSVLHPLISVARSMLNGK
ncbi:MAG: hypothetical protein GY853_08540 [PVC group bacterium]|nr:hypothetical protein [PVC group bacterium]